LSEGAKKVLTDLGVQVDETTGWGFSFLGTNLVARPSDEVWEIGEYKNGHFVKIPGTFEVTINEGEMNVIKYMEEVEVKEEPVVKREEDDVMIIDSPTDGQALTKKATAPMPTEGVRFKWCKTKVSASDLKKAIKNKDNARACGKQYLKDFCKLLGIKGASRWNVDTLKRVLTDHWDVLEQGLKTPKRAPRAKSQKNANRSKTDEPESEGCESEDSDIDKTEDPRPVKTAQSLLPLGSMPGHPVVLHDIFRHMPESTLFEAIAKVEPVDFDAARAFDHNIVKNLSKEQKEPYKEAEVQRHMKALRYLIEQMQGDACDKVAISGFTFGQLRDLYMDELEKYALAGGKPLQLPDRLRPTYKVLKHTVQAAP